MLHIHLLPDFLLETYKTTSAFLTPCPWLLGSWEHSPVLSEQSKHGDKCSVGTITYNWGKEINTKTNFRGTRGMGGEIHPLMPKY